MNGTNVSQLPQRSEQQAPHIHKTAPLQFRNKNDREIYQKFKHRSFADEAWTLNNQLKLTARLLMDAVSPNEETYPIERREAYGLHDLLTSTAALFDALEETGVLDENWMSPFKHND